MIFVECYSDTAVVKTLTSYSSKEVIHEIVGRSGVCNQLVKARGCKGLIDEDPRAGRHPYERAGTLDDANSSIDILCRNYPDTRNALIILRPKLEDWLLTSATIAHIDVTRHGLPDDPDSLHRVIDQKLSELRVLLSLLVKEQSARILALQRLLR